MHVFTWRDPIVLFINIAEVEGRGKGKHFRYFLNGILSAFQQQLRLFDFSQLDELIRRHLKDDGKGFEQIGFTDVKMSCNVRRAYFIEQVVLDEIKAFTDNIPFGGVCGRDCAFRKHGAVLMP